MAGCDVRTLASAQENIDESAYRVETSGAGGELLLRIPLPGENGSETQTWSSRITPEAPPGYPQGLWREQLTVLATTYWGASQEYWWGWFLLHLLAIERDRLPDPRPLRQAGTESLFVAATLEASGGHDRFTRYYAPEIGERVSQALSGASESYRFGFFLRAGASDAPTVGSVVAGSPASRAGLRRDDRILDVDGVTLEVALDSLDQTRSTTHEFRVFRPSDSKILEFSVQTAPVQYPSVWVDTLAGGIGYISITQFLAEDGNSTEDQFASALSEMEGLRRDRTAWILDLRDNGGGAIIASQGVAGSLLGPSVPLVRVQERQVDDDELYAYTRDTLLESPATARKALPEGKLYFLQDAGTASASEIVLSALREKLPAGRMVTYGTKSYGKGIGQLYLESPLGGFYAITCMHIDPLIAPRYHGIGISPDVATSETTILERALSDIAAGSSAGRSTSLLGGVRLADRWNLRERAFSGGRVPLQGSSLPGARGIF
jgi:C-terminal peptidase prc